MTINTRTYAMGTELTSAYSWGFYVRGRALCSDGRVRAVRRLAETADTWFSVPASVEVRGRSVSGYVTVETVDGFTTETDDDPAVVRFVANTYGKNANLLPTGK